MAWRCCTLCRKSASWRESLRCRTGRVIAGVYITLDCSTCGGGEASIGSVVGVVTEVPEMSVDRDRAAILRLER